jgi:hypothetical protein
MLPQAVAERGANIKELNEITARVLHNLNSQLPSSTVQTTRHHSLASERIAFFEKKQ